MLILRALGLGDALTAVPALRGLRRRFGGQSLIWAGPAGIGRWFRDLGLVDQVLPCAGLDRPLNRPDLRRQPGQPRHLAVNLHGRGPQSHRLLQATEPAELLAFACPEAPHGPGPEWIPDEHEVLRWIRLVGSLGAPCQPSDLVLHEALSSWPDPSRTLAPTPGSGRGLVPGQGRETVPEPIVLHPGAAAPSRRWPAGRWAELARGLAADGLQVVLTGGDSERARCRAIADRAGLPRAANLAGRLSLPALAWALAGARALVCGDTGVAHLGTALRVPSVLLFGPVPPEHWGPIIERDRHLVLWHGDRARPGDPHGEVCDPALARITVAEVRRAVQRLIGAGQAPTAGAGQAPTASWSRNHSTVYLSPSAHPT